MHLQLQHRENQSIVQTPPKKKSKLYKVHTYTNRVTFDLAEKVKNCYHVLGVPVNLLAGHLAEVVHQQPARLLHHIVVRVVGPGKTNGDFSTILKFYDMLFFFLSSQSFYHFTVRFM